MSYDPRNPYGQGAYPHPNAYPGSRPGYGGPPHPYGGPGPQMVGPANNPGNLPPGGVQQPSLDPPTFVKYMDAGVPFAEIPAYLPTLSMPYGPSVGMFTRYRPLTFTLASANATGTQRLQFDCPTAIYAMTATAVTTDGGALPVGRSALDTFTADLTRTNGDRIVAGTPGAAGTAPLGSTIFGTAQNPSLVGPRGIQMDVGSSLSVTVTSLVDTLRIDVVMWTVEVQGPSDFAWARTPLGTQG